MKRFARLIIMAAFCCVPIQGSASYIGVYFDAAGSRCVATVPANSPVTWYVLAVLGGDAFAAGITGSELRQTGTPAGWFMNASPNPAANVSLGDLLAGGANIAFPACQTPGANGILLLYTVSGFATTQVQNVSLRIERHTAPSNPNFQCPLLVRCDEPIFTVGCVSGLIGVINGFCPCCPAVEPAGWSQVKALYER